MAKSKFSLRPGNNKKPVKRLTKKELKKELLRKERAAPIVLSETEYGKWLEHTVLARLGRGEKSMSVVRAALNSAARSAKTQKEKRQLNLALREIDSALVAFQYSALAHNIMWLPAINGRKALNVVLWPTRSR